MPSSGLGDSYPLTREFVSDGVDSSLPAAYALGRTKKSKFHVHYVGRVDSNLRRRLLQHVGSYPEFKCGFYMTVEEAFEKECLLYHDFDPPDNEIHPDRPDGTSLKCPVHGCPYSKC